MINDNDIIIIIIIIIIYIYIYIEAIAKTEFASLLAGREKTTQAFEKPRNPVSSQDVGERRPRESSEADTTGPFSLSLSLPAPRTASPCAATPSSGA